MSSDGKAIGVPVREYCAVLRMLIKRATLFDRWQARKYPNHWLHKAKRELLAHGETEEQFRARIDAVMSKYSPF